MTEQDLKVLDDIILRLTDEERNVLEKFSHHMILQGTKIVFNEVCKLKTSIEKSETKINFRNSVH